jgi:hypothetical protein
LLATTAVADMPAGASHLGDWARSSAPAEHRKRGNVLARLKRVMRQTLRRAARTWAPLPLPIDRIAMGVGLPPGGKVDLYAEFPARYGDRSTARPRLTGCRLPRLAGWQRELDPAEIASANSPATPKPCACASSVCSTWSALKGLLGAPGTPACRRSAGARRPRSRPGQPSRRFDVQGLSVDVSEDVFGRSGRQRGRLQTLV